MAYSLSLFNWTINNWSQFALLGVIAGLTTSLRLGAVQLSEGMGHVFETSVNPYVVTFFMAVVALWSVTSGLHKGIKWLSNITSVLVGVLLLAVLCIGVFGYQIYNFISYIGKGTLLLFAN